MNGFNLHEQSVAGSLIRGRDVEAAEDKPCGGSVEAQLGAAEQGGRNGGRGGSAVAGDAGGGSVQGDGERCGRVGDPENGQLGARAPDLGVEPDGAVGQRLDVNVVVQVGVAEQQDRTGGGVGEGRRVVSRAGVDQGRVAEVGAMGGDAAPGGEAPVAVGIAPAGSCAIGGRGRPVQSVT